MSSLITVEIAFLFAAIRDLLVSVAASLVQVDSSPIALVTVAATVALVTVAVLYSVTIGKTLVAASWVRVEALVTTRVMK